jgi:hypothetical protein
VFFSASGGDQEQAAGSLHLPEDEGRQEDPEGQGHQASPNHLRYRALKSKMQIGSFPVGELFTGYNVFRPFLCWKNFVGFVLYPSDQDL